MSPSALVTHLPDPAAWAPLVSPSLPHPRGAQRVPRGRAGAGPPSSYSWTCPGTNSSPVASCALAPRRPDSAARPDPAKPTPGPPRRAAINRSTLAPGTGVRGPWRGAPASRPLFALLLLLLLLLPLPAGAWYKHVASPRYHTVGRAAGLLMGLRRSPYMWRRTLRAPVGPLAWDTLGLGAPPQGPSARDTLSPGPAVRDALLFPSGVQGLWEARLPVSAPRSPRPNPSRDWAPISGPQRSRPEPSESPAQPWSAQRTAFAGPHLAEGPS